RLVVAGHVHRTRWWGHGTGERGRRRRRGCWCGCRRRRRALSGARWLDDLLRARLRGRLWARLGRDRPAVLAGPIPVPAPGEDREREQGSRRRPRVPALRHRHGATLGRRRRTPRTPLARLWTARPVHRTAAR